MEVEVMSMELVVVMTVVMIVVRLSQSCVLCTVKLHANQVFCVP
jgi:hypothetical protein